MDTGRANLKFVSADRLDTSLGRLDDVTVVTPGRTQLGTLDGVLIDLDQHRIQFLVVESRGWFSSRHYLVPLGTARFVDGTRQLEADLEADDVKGLARVNPERLADLAGEGDRSASDRSQAA
jgi:hypothetical protein